MPIAEFRDERTGFGWGRTHDRRTGYFEYVIAAPSDAAAAWAALPLARSNAATLLFAADDGGIPGATDRYIWSQRADWFVTPSEGPFRHIWIVGDRVSYAAQGRLDLAPEKAPYLSMGPATLGPMEALLLVYMVLGIASALFVTLHGLRLLPDVMPAQRIAWALTALLLPVLGAVLYLAAYRRPRLNPDEHMPHFLRPAAIQAAAATAMGFGYGAPLMIVIGYVFAYFGFPLFFGAWADGWPFVFGAGMPIMMAGMYVFAVLVAWPLVQAPMAAMMRRTRARAVAWRTLGVTSLSMAAVSLGMNGPCSAQDRSHVPMSARAHMSGRFLCSLWGIAVLTAACGSTAGEPVTFPEGHGGATATAFTTRLPGDDAEAQAIAITQTVYAATREENAVGAIILTRQNAHEAFTAMHRVTHMPVNAPLLYLDAQGRLAGPTKREMERLHPDGVVQDGKTQVYVVRDVDAGVAEEIRRDLGYRVRELRADDAVALAELLDRWQAALKSDHPDEVVIAAVDHPEGIAHGMGAMAGMRTSGRGSRGCTATVCPMPPARFSNAGSVAPIST